MTVTSGSHDGHGPRSTPDRQVPANLEAVVGELAELLATLAERVKDLSDKVTKLEQAPGGKSQYRRLRPELHETAGSADRSHQELRAWVSWAVAIYRLSDVIPPCWQQHAALAEELSAFFLTWVAVWSDQTHQDSGIVWHEQLYRARERFTHWSQGARCSTACGLDLPLADDQHARWIVDLARADQDRPMIRIRRARDLHPAPVQVLSAKT